MYYTKGVFGVLNLESLPDEPMVLLDGGIESRYKEDYFFDNSCRSNYHGYLFQYTLSGCGAYESNGKTIFLTPGTAFFAAIPEKSCYYLPEKADKPWEFLYLHFNGSAVFPFFEKLTQHCGGIISIDAQTNCIQKALALHTRMISGGHLQPYEGGEFLYGFLCGLLRHVLHPAAFHTESTASQAALLMEKEFATIGGIDEVAKRLHISSEHLSRSFHSEWGIAPVQYLNRMRIQSAMNDLLGSTDTIEVIAVKNGFANGNYFAKVFRRYTKMTPCEYRCKKTGQIRTLSV